MLYSYPLLYPALAVDMVGDTWLIGAPLYILKKMRLARRDHRVIAAVFLCGLFTTIASILHDAFILAEEFSMVGFTAHIQVNYHILPVTSHTTMAKLPLT